MLIIRRRAPELATLSEIAGIDGKGAIDNLSWALGSLSALMTPWAGKGMKAGSPVVMLNRGFSNARRAGGRNPA